MVAFPPIAYTLVNAPTPVKVVRCVVDEKNI